MTETDTSGIERLGKAALMVGVAALLVCVAAGWGNPAQFLHSYLFAFLFWIALPLGSTALLMLHHMVGGRWGFALQRVLEAGAKTMVLMAVLFLPILFRLPVLYRWADPNLVKADPLLQYKHPYLNTPFFITRTAIYFGAWILMTYLLTEWSRRQDETGDPSLVHRMQSLSAPGLAIYGLTATFASVDWVMSLEPHWYSTIYGMIFMVTEALAAMSLVTLTVILLSRQKPLAGVLTTQNVHDYGNLLLTFTMLWAYLSFSQFLIIWAGNLREEIPWYMTRARGGWAAVAVALIIFHFAMPFLLLLSRFVKRRAEVLRWLAAWLLLISVVDVFWLTVPAFEPAGPEFHLTDLLAILGIGGLWVWRFAGRLNARPLLPLHDPRFKEVAQHA